MWWEKLILLSVLFLFVSCQYADGDYDTEENVRKPRLFTFNTVDDDVRVDLSFNVPFLVIPVKKAMNSVSGAFSGAEESHLPSININPASLLVGGATILSLALLLPLLMKSFAQHNYEKGYSRLLDDAQFGTDALLEFANVLADGKAFSGCATRVACWAGHRSGADSTRFWHHLTRNALVSSLVNTTAIEEAMRWGRKGRDCSSYAPCPLREEQFPALMDTLDNFMSNFRQ